MLMPWLKPVYTMCRFSRFFHSGDIYCVLAYLISNKVVFGNIVHHGL